MSDELRKGLEDISGKLNGLTSLVILSIKLLTGDGDPSGGLVGQVGRHGARLDSLESGRVSVDRDDSEPMVLTAKTRRKIASGIKVLVWLVGMVGTIGAGAGLSSSCEPPPPLPTQH